MQVVLRTLRLACFFGKFCDRSTSSSVVVTDTVWNSMRVSSGYFGMSGNNDHDTEAVGVDSGAATSQVDHVILNFMPPSVGFSEQSVQNRGRRGNRAPPLHNTHGPQSFYHLQHRYTKLITFPVVAIMIGILLAFILFEGISFSATKGVAAKASSSSLPANDYAKPDVDDNVDRTIQARFSRIVINNHTRAVGRAGMMIRRRVLDTLHEFLWVRTSYHFHL